jgi:hypothetical protein
MSVFKLPLKDFASITSTIKYDARFRDHFLSLEEKGELSLLLAYPPTDKYIDNEIRCFVERLYIANALAFAYMYGEKPIIIERLTEENLEGSLIEVVEFIKTLRTLRYNLYTNAGNSFLSEKDMKKLNFLIEYATEAKAHIYA